MTPIQLLQKYYPPTSQAYKVLLHHSERVMDKARAVAKSLGVDVDLDFVCEAALLHDIGIVHTNAPDLGCFGTHPYLSHGYLGREILEAEGYPRHALVCDRHIGVGLTAEEIRRQQLPLPLRDMVPLTLEEKIVAYADLFFSKSPQNGGGEKTAGQVRAGLERFGQEKVAIFDSWHAAFGVK